MEYWIHDMEIVKSQRRNMEKHGVLDSRSAIIPQACDTCHVDTCLAELELQATCCRLRRTDGTNVCLAICTPFLFAQGG